MVPVFLLLVYSKISRNAFSIPPHIPHPPSKQLTKILNNKQFGHYPYNKLMTVTHQHLRQKATEDITNTANNMSDDWASSSAALQQISLDQESQGDL